MAIPRDISWIANSFLLAGGKVEKNKDLRRYRRMSGADFKYMGSGFGEDVVLNPRPQFTPFADIRAIGLWGGGGEVQSPGNISSYFTGMGRAYSDMFHDGRQIMHIRFGVTQYKGLLTFFTGFYDQSAALLARSGRASIAYYFAYTVASIATLWLSPVILVGKGINYLLGRNSSSYMSLKPTMALYWLRANTIMNNFGSNLGIIPRTLENTGLFKEQGDVVDGEGNAVNTGGYNDFRDLSEAQNSRNYVEFMHRLLPNVWDRNGQLDLQMAVNQGIRRQRAWNARISSIVNNNGKSGKAVDTYNAILDSLSKPLSTKDFPGMSMKNYLDEYHGTVMGSLANKNLDSDNVEDMTMEKIRAGDLDGLQAMRGATQAGQETQSAQGGEIGEAPPPEQPPADPAAAAPAEIVPPFMPGQDPASQAAAATGGVVDQGQSATAETQMMAEAAGISTGMSPEEFTKQARAAKPREMLTVQRPKDTPESTDADQEAAAGAAAVTEIDDTGIPGKMYNIVMGWLSGVGKEFEAEWNRGSAFLNLEVNYTGAGSLSLSNSMKDTFISGTLKGASAAARDTRISASDFNTGFAFVDAGMSLVRDLFTGTLDAVKLGGLMALAGNGFPIIPKQWDDSTVTIPTANVTIELQGFSGNPIYSYMYHYPVIACLLAGAVCPSTGPQSYTAPFVCEAYSRGAFAIRYGMISSLTIRHGTGNLGYTDDRRPINFSIDLEIANLNDVFHAAISNGASPVNIFKRVFDDENSFNDYMSTITGLAIDDMVDPRRRFSIRLANQMANVRSWWSPSHIAGRLNDSAPVTILNKILGPSTFPGM